MKFRALFTFFYYFRAFRFFFFALKHIYYKKAKKVTGREGFYLMEFFKKSIVLKQTEKGYSLDGKHLSGIARVEIESGVCDFYLTLINALTLTDATFKAGILNGKAITVLELGKRPSSAHFSLDGFKEKDGFAVGLFVEKDDIPITVAFAKDSSCDLTLTDFKKAIAEKCLSDRKTKQKTVSFAEETKPEQSTLLKTPYDDEAVATVNYYDLDGENNEFLDLKEKEDVRYKNELPFIDSQEKAQQVADLPNCFSDEADLDFRTELKEEQPYYRTVEKELDNIFGKFPAETCLENMFPESRFAKINYSNDKYYVVGLIKERGAEKYICYGVPGTYSPEPPKELKGYCSFIPLSVFCLDGEGYWMMFQDAVSGKCINCTTF